jgi:arginyl-tRNA synthetase
MALRVYDTLTRQKKDFQPVQPGKVGMYVCGPTVYKPSHIGHMVGPVIFDAVKRYLTYLGYQVTWVVNITDVDDKLIVRAKELGTTVKELAEKMTVDYVENLKKLNVTGVDRMPKATAHIGDMIEIMRGLIDKGYAYAAGGDEGRRLRQVVPPRRGANGGRRPRRGQRPQAQPRRLRLVEGGQAGRAAVGQPVGAGPPRLAHRVLGHEHEAAG